MISDKLYELAFEYKKTKLWKTLYDRQIFAVKLSDGRIGYISIMGAAGEVYALSLYLEAEGFSSFRRLAKLVAEFDLPKSPFEYQEYFMSQDCLQCAFENKNMLSDEEIKEVKNFTGRNNIRLSGRNSYPQFIKYKPYFYPWHLQTDKEIEDLCEALSAAIELSKLLKTKNPKELGLIIIDAETKEVPMLELQNEGYVLTKTELPPAEPVKTPIPRACNDINIAKLKKFQKKGVWECEILRIPEPIQENKEDAPVFPVMLLAVDSLTGYVISSISNYYDEEPERLLNKFIDTFLSTNVCPREIKVRDERTHLFIKILCDKLNIPLSTDEELSALEEAEMDLWEHLNSTENDQINGIIDVLDTLLELDDEQLNDALPDAAFEQLGMILEQEMLPKEIEDKLKRIYNIRNGEKSNGKNSKIRVLKTVSDDKSYVISVSVGTGCYRHIQISAGSTLEELHLAIQDAFEFDNDHAHAFFMDNIYWSHNNCYYCKEMEDGSPSTDMYTLNNVGLQKGTQFKYLFDFGDEWRFQCKVLRIEDKNTSEPMIIRSKGKAPDQYYYDEEWDDE